MNKLFSFVFLFFVFSISAVLFCIAFPLWLFSLIFDRKRILLHQFTCFWGALPIWIHPGWRVNVIDRNKFNSSNSHIIVANHQSQLDILLSFHLFKHFKWVSKREVFKIPFIGWNMFLNNYIGIIRGSKKSTEIMMQECEDRLMEGSSVFFFPEGTRSRTGQVMKFKAGAFILAHKLKLPLLLVAIHGTGKALPKHSIEFTGVHNLHLKVVGEMPYEDFESLTVEETAEKARNIIIDEVEKLKIQET